MYIAQTHSTNSLLREQFADREHLFTIRTDFQTAGRGQAGNSWESEKGKNLLFSTLLRGMDIDADRQFLLSMAAALAVRDMLASEVEKCGIDNGRMCVKWPNDIYWDNGKICGILIEAVLQGRLIDYAIAGIGVNINQTRWIGTAPNPVSLKQITGREYDLEELMGIMLEKLRYRLEETKDAGRLKEDYMSVLFRRTGWHTYARREVSTAPTMPLIKGGLTDDTNLFEGEIDRITEQGELVMNVKNGGQKVFHFKEIQFVL